MPLPPISLPRFCLKKKKIGMTIDDMPHCGLEVFLGKGLCVIGGEVTTRSYVDIEKVIRKTVLSLDTETPPSVSTAVRWGF
jgi:S-adenosylmethionine synthetase